MKTVIIYSFSSHSCMAHNKFSRTPKLLFYIQYKKKKKICSMFKNRKSSFEVVLQLYAHWCIHMKPFFFFPQFWLGIVWYKVRTARNCEKSQLPFFIFYSVTETAFHSIVVNILLSWWHFWYTEKKSVLDLIWNNFQNLFSVLQISQEISDFCKETSNTLSFIK